MCKCKCKCKCKCIYGRGGNRVAYLYQLYLAMRIHHVPGIPALVPRLVEVRILRGRSVAQKTVGERGSMRGERGSVMINDARTPKFLGWQNSALSDKP